MLGKRGSVRVWWTHVWKVSHIIIEDYKIRFIYSPGWQEHWPWQAKLTCHEACFIAPKGVTWTCRVCWSFFLAMAMWQGRPRENVCDWRLRRSDWSSGMNAAEYILCASLCQRMCKISSEEIKEIPNTKKSMEWNANHSMPTRIQKTLGLGQFRFLKSFMDVGSTV